MAEDALEKVKEVEERAAKILEESTHDKEKIIADAKKKALDIMEEADASAKKEREKLLEKLRKELEKEKQEKMETAEFSIRKLKTDSKSKLSKEANFLYEKFLEAI